MKTMKPRTLFVVFVLLILCGAPLHAAPAPDLDDQTRAIATEMRCVVCQNLSVADSPSEMAQQMRAIVREQLQAGKSPDQIKDFFVSKYGEWVLLKPKTTGVSALLWILPYVVLTLGVIAALWLVHRWAQNKKPPLDTSGQAPVPQKVQSDLVRAEVEQPDLEDASARAQLLRERARLRTELTDLDFDFQSGKLSESDYSGLKQEIETKAAGVIQRLNTLPPEPTVKSRPVAKSVASRSFRRWQIVTGGAFLMLFGLALGVMLTKSMRPRESESDTRTGDFLTGTTPASDAARDALNEGKQAFGKQDFPKAIDALKKVLDADPNNPEAHTYMGYILIQTGHGDGALMAFDKALSHAPNFPMALWGKGMVLYQEKKDFAGAREVLERLLNLLPPGEGRNEVVKVLADIPTTGGTPGRPAASAKSTAASSSSAQISGKITINPKLKANVDSQATLFIIARPATVAKGPPTAVKKIDYPVFPLSYSVGPENVMMQGTPFAGAFTLTARLDKDGNPGTRQPGDLTGDYKKNPVAVSSQNIDIVLDQVVQ